MQEEKSKTYSAFITYLDNEFEHLKFERLHVENGIFYFYAGGVIEAISIKSTKKIKYRLPE